MQRGGACRATMRSWYSAYRGSLCTSMRGASRRTRACSNTPLRRPQVKCISTIGRASQGESIDVCAVTHATRFLDTSRFIVLFKSTLANSQHVTATVHFTHIAPPLCSCHSVTKQNCPSFNKLQMKNMKNIKKIKGWKIE